eukprot:403344011
MEDTEMKDDFDDYSYHTPPDTTPQTYIPTVSTSSLKFYVATIRDSLGIERFIDEPLDSSNHKFILYTVKVPNRGLHTKQIILQKRFKIKQNQQEQIDSPLKYITINISDIVLNRRSKQLTMSHFISKDGQSDNLLMGNVQQYKTQEQKVNEISMICLKKGKILNSVISRIKVLKQKVKPNHIQYDIKKHSLKSINKLKFQYDMQVYSFKVRGDFLLVIGQRKDFHTQLTIRRNQIQNNNNNVNLPQNGGAPEECKLCVATLIINLQNQETIYDSALLQKEYKDEQNQYDEDLTVYFDKGLSIFNKLSTRSNWFGENLDNTLQLLAQQQKQFQIQNNYSLYFKCYIFGEIHEISELEDVDDMSNLTETNLINYQFKIFTQDMNHELFKFAGKKQRPKHIKSFKVNQYDSPYSRIYMQGTKMLLGEVFDIVSHPYIIEVTSQTITLWNVRLNIDVTVKSLSSRDYYVFYESQAFVRRNPRTKHLELYVFGYSKQQNRIDIFDIEYLKQFVAQ